MSGWIGVYDYTVIITYFGAGCSLLGMYMAFAGNISLMFLCQGLALLSDFIDGSVARTKKNRTKEEKMFGVQIDSLCDVISFGVFPAIVFYNGGMKTAADIAIEAFFVLCCVCRLANYNVLAVYPEEKDGADFHGLPVPALTVTVPAIFMLRLIIPAEGFVWVLRAVMIIMGILYIRNFKMNRIKPAMIALGVIFYAAPCLYHMITNI